jgi:hypothetical protein
MESAVPWASRVGVVTCCTYVSGERVSYEPPIRYGSSLRYCWSQAPTALVPCWLRQFELPAPTTAAAKRRVWVISHADMKAP